MGPDIDELFKFGGQKVEGRDDGGCGNAGRWKQHLMGRGIQWLVLCHLVKESLVGNYVCYAGVL